MPVDWRDVFEIREDDYDPKTIKQIEKTMDMFWSMPEHQRVLSDLKNTKFQDEFPPDKIIIRRDTRYSTAPIGVTFEDDDGYVYGYRHNGKGSRLPVQIIWNPEDLSSVRYMDKKGKNRKVELYGVGALTHECLHIVYPSEEWMFGPSRDHKEYEKHDENFIVEKNNDLRREFNKRAKERFGYGFHSANEQAISEYIDFARLLTKAYKNEHFSEKEQQSLLQKAANLEYVTIEFSEDGREASGNFDFTEISNANIGKGEEFKFTPQGIKVW